MEGFPDPLRTYLTLGNFTVNRDVTHAHLFLGYKPLVIGIPIVMASEDFQILQKNEEVVLYFMQDPASTDPGRHEFQTERSVAKLILRQREVVVLDEYALFVYEGVAGEHSFLNRGHQLVNTVLQKLRPVQATNINLVGNLWDQVRIAYSIPRQISIITVSDGTLINMFPTDLHGPVGKNFYAGSLRIGGKANEQVEKYKRIVISKVDVSSHRESYSLGKNHMADLRGTDSFLIHEERSSIFNFPLPFSVVSYAELILTKSIELGIHCIHLYEVVHQAEVQPNCKTLGHIHQYYAQWRANHGLETQLYFR